MAKVSTGLGRELPPLQEMPRLPVAGAAKFRVNRGRVVLVTEGLEVARRERGGTDAGRGVTGSPVAHPGEARNPKGGSLQAGSSIRTRTEFHASKSGCVRATGYTQICPPGAENQTEGPSPQVLLPNERERHFVEEYLRCGDAHKARTAAGFSKNYPPQMILDRPCVQQLIKETVLKAKDTFTRTSADTLKDIQDIIKDTKAQREFKTALKALELEGKILGIFSETLKIEKKESHEDRLRRAVAQLDQRNLLPPVPDAPAQFVEAPARCRPAAAHNLDAHRTEQSSAGVAHRPDSAGSPATGPHGERTVRSNGADAAGGRAPGAYRNRVVFRVPAPVIDITPEEPSPVEEQF